jgi:Spy/CpxP family protein refolding chaperone
MRTLSGILLFTTLAAATLGPQVAARQPATDLPGIVTSYDGLLQNESVYKELKLTDEQIQQCKEVIRTVRQRHRVDFDKLRQTIEKNPEVGMDERREKVMELMRIISKEVLEGVTDVLKPGQLTRLKQIELQERGLRAFTDADVSKALHLTAEQKDKVKAIRAETHDAIKEIFKRYQHANYTQALKQIQGLHEKELDRGLALLSADQKKAWKRLIGEPFVFKRHQASTPAGKEKNSSTVDK